MGGGVALLLKVGSVLIPAFSIAVPMIFGLGLLGTYVVSIFIASLAEEPIFRFFLLGFLTDKQTISKPDSRRLRILIIIGIFLSLLILINFFYRTGLIYTLLGVIALIVCILWKKIPSLNLPFWISAIISSIIFSIYHIRVYSGVIELSAILSVSSAFISAFVVGVLACYLVKYQKSLMGAIVLHAVFNATIMFSQIVVVA